MLTTLEKGEVGGEEKGRTGVIFQAGRKEMEAGAGKDLTYLRNSSWSFFNLSALK